MSISRAPWTRRVAAMAVAALALGGLVACAPGGGSDSDADGVTTVKWWSWNPSDQSSQPWIDAFEKDNPKIKIEHRFIQYSDYVNAVRLAAQTDDGPDVFGLQVGALTNQFAPLTVDLAPLAAKEIGSDWKDQLLATDQLEVEGKQVGLPWMITGGGLVWYNKTILDKAGIAEPPTTLAEWQDDCSKVEALGVTCFVQGAKDDWINLDMYQSIINQIDPGVFYDAVIGKGDFTGSAFVKAFDVWKKLFDDGLVQDGALAQTQYPDANDAFHNSTAAFILNGTWQDGDLTKAGIANGVATYGDQLTQQAFLPFALPDVVGGAKETGRLFGGPDVGWAISAKSKVQDAAFSFVQWLTASENGQKMMASSLQGQPALASVPVDDSDVISDLGKAALTEQATQLGDLIGARQIPSAEVQTALGLALSSVASGQMNSEDAAASVQKAIDGAY